VAYGPTIFVFGLMLCEECTKVIPQRHHVIIFFGLFFEWCAPLPCLGSCHTLNQPPLTTSTTFSSHARHYFKAMY